LTDTIEISWIADPVFGEIDAPESNPNSAAAKTVCNTGVAQKAANDLGRLHCEAAGQLHPHEPGPVLADGLRPVRSETPISASGLLQQRPCARLAALFQKEGMTPLNATPNEPGRRHLEWQLR